MKKIVLGCKGIECTRHNCMKIKVELENEIVKTQCKYKDLFLAITTLNVENAWMRLKCIK